MSVRSLPAGTRWWPRLHALSRGHRKARYSNLFSKCAARPSQEKDCEPICNNSSHKPQGLTISLALMILLPLSVMMLRMTGVFARFGEMISLAGTSTGHCRANR